MEKAQTRLETLLVLLKGRVLIYYVECNVFNNVDASCEDFRENAVEKLDALAQNHPEIVPLVLQKVMHCLFLC